MVRDDPYAQVVVPAHRALAVGTLAAIFEATDLKLDDFIDLL